jgi:hypothetical protein
LERSVNNHPFDDIRLKVIHVGYATPQNLQVYALYLDSRIRAYKDLKNDAIRASIPDRGKTITGRKIPSKIRSMTVEKGLFQEIKVVHSMIDALVECKVCLQ